MIIVDTALAKRAAAGRPIKVGMIGAGFMGSGVALQIAESVPGMTLAAIASRNPQRGIDTFAQTMPAGDVVRATNQGMIEDAIRSGKPVVTDDPEMLSRAEGLDAVLEVTGSMDFAARGILAAIETGKHVILMNAELDGTVGPLLNEKARRAGVVFTNVDGDQPGVQMNLFRFVRGIGVKPVLCGNIKGLQDPYRTPDTQRGFAEKWGQNVEMVTSFADGTKISYEQAIVANGTGMRVARRGMIGPDPTHRDPTQPLRPLEDYIALLAPHIDPEGPGIVDFVVGAKPGPGVFVLGTHPNPRQQHYLNLYKLGTGPFYLFYTPYHLCHFEVPMTIARAVLFQDAALAPLGPPKVGVVSLAKKDLRAGDVIDDMGGFMTYAEADNIESIVAGRLLPTGLASGCRLKRAVPKDAVLTFDDVEIPEGRLIDQLYDEQAVLFGLTPAGISR